MTESFEKTQIVILRASIDAAWQRHQIFAVNSPPRATKCFVWKIPAFKSDFIRSAPAMGKIVHLVSPQAKSHTNNIPRICTS